MFVRSLQVMKAFLLDSALPFAQSGESPLWDHQNGLLYWVDTPACLIYRYALKNGRWDMLQTPSDAGFLSLQKSGLIAGLKDGIYKTDFTDFERLCSLDRSGTRFNDGACDADGNLWAGTMTLDPKQEEETGALYHYQSGKISPVRDGFAISNGIAWSPDWKTMYHADTTRGIVWAYDYDMRDKAISAPRIFIHVKNSGKPDGVCVDAAGRIYVALYGGWGIDIFLPNGKYEGRLSLPVPNVTSCAFGGFDLSTLFITTARQSMSTEDIAKSPLSGGVFMCHIGRHGRPEPQFRDD